MDSISINPFKPGAGHMPPYLAGRDKEKKEFSKLLAQSTILENLVLTGLRGVGKTVFLEILKPKAQKNHWLWVGNDLSESASISENSISIRILTDLSILTSNIIFNSVDEKNMGFINDNATTDIHLNFNTLKTIYDKTPGLPSDKLKHVLEIVWATIVDKKLETNGIIFAYDEAQNLADHEEKDQFPLSLLLDCFQSIQKKEIPFMLVLTGLPTLFPGLVLRRTYAERMFRVITLDKLSDRETKKAITEPLKNNKLQLPDESVNTTIKLSGGYPYFIQFICREVYDLFAQKINNGEQAKVPADEIVQKLDTDFFAGRWARATDRQRELLFNIAKLKNHDSEFTVQDVVNISKSSTDKPFSSSHVNQMLGTLSKIGLIYKNRHGKYLFAVPLLGDFINRQNQ